jgi:hypothetical protein
MITASLAFNRGTSVLPPEESQYWIVKRLLLRLKPCSWEIARMG